MSIAFGVTKVQAERVTTGVGGGLREREGERYRTLTVHGKGRVTGMNGGVQQEKTQKHTSGMQRVVWILDPVVGEEEEEEEKEEKESRVA